MDRTLRRTSATFIAENLDDPAKALLLCDTLAHTRGVLQVTVNWKARSVRVKFDETVLTVQSVARVVSEEATARSDPPGSVLLVLKVARCQKTTPVGLPPSILNGFNEVADAALHPRHRAVTVKLAACGRLTTRQLIDAFAAHGLVVSSS